MCIDGDWYVFSSIRTKEEKGRRRRRKKCMSLFWTTIKGRWSASSSAGRWRVRLEFSVVWELTMVLILGGSRNYRDSWFHAVDPCKSFEEMRAVRKDRPLTALDDWQGQEFVRSRWEYHDGSLIVCTFFPPREGKYPNRCCTKDHWRTKQIKFIRIRSFKTEKFEKIDHPRSRTVV